MEIKAYVPRTYFDPKYFIEGKAYYIEDASGGRLEAILALNLETSLLFVTGLGPPWEISVQDAANEKYYLSPIAPFEMEESA